ncbi:MAG: hypothetical protein ACRD2J_16555 [Thermoanaerobaculia bacterium]
MAIELRDGLSADAIRILQEFRRMGKSELGHGEIDAIRHPAGGGEAPLNMLITKEFVERSPDGTYRLTSRGETFLGVDYRPLYERG